MASTLTGRKYLRQSRDRSGQLKSAGEQDTYIDTIGAQLGVSFNGEDYAEPGAVSASRYGHKVRGDFTRLTGDLQAGRFGAGVLAVYDNARGSRQVREWLDVIDGCEAAGVLILIASDERLYNPALPGDRKTLINGATDAEHFSAVLSRRLSIAASEGAAAGAVWGAAPYGYHQQTVTVFDERKGRNVRRAVRHVDGSEAEVVRQLFTRIRKGHTMRAIAADFAAAGVTGRLGKPMSAATLRNMACRAAYAGLREHHGTLTEAQWPAIVDRETFDAVQHILAGRKHQGRRAQHLLGAIGRCGECGGPLQAVRDRRGEFTYICHDKSCCRIGETVLDELAEERIIAWLSDPSVWARLQPDRTAELGQARAATEHARAELAQLRTAAASGKLTVQTVMAMEPGLVAAVQAAEDNERQLSAPSELAGLVDPAEGIWESWAAMPMSARRKAARIVLSPNGAGVLRLHKAPNRRQVPAEQRVSFAVT